MAWETQQPGGNIPSTRNNHISVVVARTKIFVHGGHDGRKWLSDLHILDTDHTHAGENNNLCWVTPNVAGECPPARVSICFFFKRLFSTHFSIRRLATRLHMFPRIRAGGGWSCSGQPRDV